MSAEKILGEDNGSSAGSLRSDDSDSTPESATDSLNSLFKTIDNTCVENCIEKTKCEGNKKKGICCSKLIIELFFCL